jgi:hypothetical protein
LVAVCALVLEIQPARTNRITAKIRQSDLISVA